MRNFRRVIVLCLAVVMGLSVAACGAGSEAEPTSGTTVNPTDASTASPTDEMTQAPTSQATQSATATQGATQAPTSAPTTAPVAVEGEGAVLWQVAVKNALTMSYVIKTKNNKIIVIDGGGDSNSGTYNKQMYPKNEIDELMKVLKEATGEQVPTIDAWIFTHVHSDHVNSFSHMINNMPGTVNVGKVYYNFPSDQYLYDTTPSWKPTDNTTTLAKFKKAVGQLNEDQIVIVEEGASYTVDNVTFNIILTPDETDNSLRSNSINESSIVFDMKLGGQRVLFLGDLGPFSSNRFVKAMKKTESMNVDVVQMGHHGSQGITMSYYWTIKPKACLWPTPTFMWAKENQTGGGGSYSLETQAVYDFLVKKGVKHHYKMTDGTIKLEFPLDLS